MDLNKGAKWQTDESTGTHAVKPKANKKAFNANDKADVAAYRALTGNMQKKLNSLVSDCKMKGAEHVALHLWPDPVLKDVSNL